MTAVLSGPVGTRPEGWPSARRGIGASPAAYLDLREEIKPIEQHSFTIADFLPDKTKVDAATQQVQQGARQIGQGSVGTGIKETAKGIGNTVVEGAKFSGQKIKEFFTSK